MKSGSLGTDIAPTERKSKFASFRKIFKPWKWIRKKRREKIEKAAIELSPDGQIPSVPDADGDKNVESPPDGQIPSVPASDADKTLESSPDGQIPNVSYAEKIVKLPPDGQTSNILASDTDKIVESSPDGPISSLPNVDADKTLESSPDDQIPNVPYADKIVKLPHDDQTSNILASDTDKIVESSPDGQISSVPDADADKTLESSPDDQIPNVHYADKIVKLPTDDQTSNILASDTDKIVESSPDGQISSVPDVDTDKIVESPPDGSMDKVVELPLGQTSSVPIADTESIVGSPLEDQISNVHYNTDIQNVEGNEIIQHGSMLLEEQRRLLKKHFSIVIEEIEPLGLLLSISNKKPQLRQLYPILKQIGFRKKRAIKFLLEILIHYEDCIQSFLDALKLEHEYCYKEITSKKVLRSLDISTNQICDECSKKAFSEFLNHCTSIPVELFIELLQEDIIEIVELELYTCSDNQQQLQLFKNILAFRNVPWITFIELASRIPKTGATQVARIIEKVDICPCHYCETAYSLSKILRQKKEESSIPGVLSIDKNISAYSLPGTVAVLTLNTDGTKEHEKEIVKKIILRKEHINSRIKEYGKIKTAWCGSVIIILELSSGENEKIKYEGCILKIVRKILEDEEIKQDLNTNDISLKVSVTEKDTAEVDLITQKIAIVSNFTFLLEELYIQSFMKPFAENGIMEKEEFKTRFKKENRKLCTKLFLEYVLESQNEVVHAFFEVIHQEDFYESLAIHMDDFIQNTRESLSKNNTVIANNQAEQLDNKVQNSNTHQVRETLEQEKESLKEDETKEKELSCEACNGTQSFPEFANANSVQGNQNCHDFSEHCHKCKGILKSDNRNENKPAASNNNSFIIQDMEQSGSTSDNEIENALTNDEIQQSNELTHNVMPMIGVLDNPFWQIQGLGLNSDLKMMPSGSNPGYACRCTSMQQNGSRLRPSKIKIKNTVKSYVYNMTSNSSSNTVNDIKSNITQVGSDNSIGISNKDGD